jgi:hypothetical protein
LSKSQKIYVFRYGATALYALTIDRSGHNLPLQTGTADWRFERHLTLRRDKNAPKYELIKTTLAALARHGFILTHAAIQPLPIAALHHRSKLTEAKEQLASSRL